MVSTEDPSQLPVDLPSTSVGPESLTFDTKYEEEPYYTGISDGRIIKYDGANGFIDYAFTVPNRSKEVCDGIGNNRPDLEPTCGRPLGIGFYLRTKQLFIADAYQGFLVVAPNERVATKIASGAEGVPFKLPTGLDVDQLTGNVYFTDASSQYSLRSRRNFNKFGRIFRPRLRIHRKPNQEVLLTGPKAFTSEVLITFQGRPINIKRTSLGEFWVAVNIQTQNASSGTITNIPTGIKINSTGNILRTVDLSQFYGDTNISDFQQRKRQFYVGTLRTDFLGRLSI
ncbi:hypothetical protein L484_004319 [Morus notabilis]|uniref:Strictosidine synthase 1 n=1 Tax=Morus notabilis TaxID=981085 RepID=W9S481_9ROSA|nr:hypothetical protein L484_004319 [Morus notabilis]